MKEHARKKLVELFANSNHLNVLAISPNAQKAIAETVAPFYLFVEYLGINDIASSPNPVDGILITWVNRNYQVLSGMLSLLALEKFQHAEILSRTIMESSLTLLYIEQENTNTRIVQYLDAYVRQEKEQNRKWQKETETAPDLVRTDHLHRIGAKNEAMDNYELFNKLFANGIGAPYPTDKGWPNFIGICSALGKAIDYRTVYMAMCSQSHHDAEDILNDLMIGSIQNSTECLSLSVKEITSASISFYAVFGIIWNV